MPKSFKNYFDKNYPKDDKITRKVRIGLEAFKRIMKDSPKIEISTAADLAKKIAKINILSTEWHNFNSQVIQYLKK